MKRVAAFVTVLVLVLAALVFGGEQLGGNFGTVGGLISPSETVDHAGGGAPPYPSVIPTE